MDHDESPTFKVLPKSTKRLLPMMEGEIGSGDCAAVRWDDFRSDGFSTAQLQVGLKVLAYLGFVTVELDGRRNLYRKSEDWRRLDILIKA